MNSKAIKNLCIQVECAEFVQFNVAEKYVEASTCAVLCWSIDGRFLLHSQNQHYILTLWIKRFFFLMLSGLSCYEICFNTQSRLLDVCSYLNFIFTIILFSFLLFLLRKFMLGNNIKWLHNFSLHKISYFATPSEQTFFKLKMREIFEGSWNNKQ